MIANAPDMPLEIERKFLVSNDAWRFTVIHVTSIRQGYAAFSRGVMRVRVADTRAILTLKCPIKELTRSEYEYEIPLKDANELLAGFCENSLVEKIRYRVCCSGIEWDIDVFSGANDGLITAEIELSAPDQVFEHPPWLGEEVSNQPAYFNSNLARNPFCAWKKAKSSRLT